MSDNTKVSIYYGPLLWFHKQLETKEWQYLLDIVSEQDEEKRHIIHTANGQTAPEDGEDRPRPKLVVAESADYASVQEHAIMNFVGLIRSIDPEQLILHNPPLHIHVQLEREFSIEVERYAYPVVTRDTLVRLRDGFASHLVGQAAVKEQLLAALYPLTTARCTKPVVLMFYGPSGVGKTETAQFINSLLRGTLLRKQFSMFHSDKFASYLFGGGHFEASFARDLLDRESGVILIDEFDKANSIFHSAFYQFFDEGVFEDKNYRVQLGPSLVICTSNYETDNEIRKTLGEALYSRFDSIIQFKSLSIDEIRQVIDRIVDKNLKELTSEEQVLLDVHTLKDKLYCIANQSGNIRKLSKIINEVISLKLVREMFGSVSEERN